ncbi:DUF302 domain-containing protein [Sphingomonas sp. TDK1]|uniref:DUF302 domain-containing protein n=1 Tax=Sphingomonas sp. TDK1 TaxID=453247 RepID=UPI0007DA0949|nr:DUF302 domain-containing protein [Sphingomonas sp. TDK1]OAN66590.1 hypothetical protein A7X12_10680 [Sphingomonas sp. TDK1]
MLDEPQQTATVADAPGFVVEPFDGEKLHRLVPAGFDTVVARLSDSLGRLSADEVNVIAADADGHEAFRATVQARLGSSGFIILGVIDHGAWLALFGHPGRLERWFVGNPLIAETMIAEDRVAGLFAPVELLLDEVGPEATRITIVRPSTLIGGGRSATLDRIIAMLDAKVLALIASAG